MRVLIKNVEDLDDDEYKKCHRLNFGSAGLMQEQLDLCRYEPSFSKKKSKVVMILDDDLLVGWALAFPEYRKRGYSAYFYVRSSHRGNGYGARLFDEVKKFDPKPRCFPHDIRSGGLFKKYSIRCESYERMWLQSSGAK